MIRYHDDDETPYPTARFRSPSWVHQSRMRRIAFNLLLLLSTGALIAYYALVHIRYIQEDGVWHTSWFYEWFLIPILLSFSFAAPLHRALGYDCANTRRQQDECKRRLELLQKDTTTQLVITAVAVCYMAYIVGDAAFFIPISSYYQVIATYPIYLLAVTTNIGFMYQGFLLTILTMRAFCVRLHELHREILSTVLRTTLLRQWFISGVISGEQIMQTGWIATRNCETICNPCHATLDCVWFSV